MLFCVQAQRQARLVSLVRRADGSWGVAKPSAEIPSGAVTVLGYVGVGIFAELERERRAVADHRRDRDAVVVLEVRTIPDVPSATLVDAFGRWSDQFTARGCRLILAGVDDRLAETLGRSGLANRIGPENIFPAAPVLLASVDDAYETGAAWLTNRSGDT